MSNRNLLFYEIDLEDQLRARRQQVNDAVNNIPEQQFRISNDQEIVEHIVVRLTVSPLVLQEGAMTMNQTETQVDVSGDARRMFLPQHEGPSYIQGTRVDVNIPFTGGEWIFKYRTNPWSLDYPCAEVKGRYLRISTSLPHDDKPERFKEIYSRKIQLIQEYVYSSYAQVEGYNRSLPQLVQQAINNRRERLSKHADIAALLEIPLAKKAGAPSITPVKVEIRRPPPLPVPPETGLTPETGAHK